MRCRSGACRRRRPVPGAARASPPARSTARGARSPSTADGDDEERRPHEGDEQLGVDAGGDAPDSLDQRIAGRGQQPALPGTRLAASSSARTESADTCSDLQLGRAADHLVINQLRRLFATSMSAAVVAAIFSLLTSMKRHSKCSVPRSPLTVTFIFQAGWSETQCVSGLNPFDFNHLPDLLDARRRLSPDN